MDLHSVVCDMLMDESAAWRAPLARQVGLEEKQGIRKKRKGIKRKRERLSLNLRPRRKVGRHQARQVPDHTELWDDYQMHEVIAREFHRYIIDEVRVPESLSRVTESHFRTSIRSCLMLKEREGR